MHGRKNTKQDEKVMLSVSTISKKLRSNIEGLYCILVEDLLFAIPTGKIEFENRSRKV